MPVINEIAQTSWKQWAALAKGPCAPFHLYKLLHLLVRHPKTHQIYGNKTLSIQCPWWAGVHCGEGKAVNPS